MLTPTGQRGSEHDDAKGAVSGDGAVQPVGSGVTCWQPWLWRAARLERWRREGLPADADLVAMLRHRSRALRPAGDARTVRPASPPAAGA